MPLSSKPDKRRNQLANLKNIQKGEVRNPKGRLKHPKTMSMFINEMKEKGYEVPTPRVITESYLYLATLPEEELKNILGDKSRPMMQRIIAKGILNKKGIDVLDRIVDRAYGKIQHIDLTSKGEQIKSDPLQMHFVTNSEEYNKVLTEIQNEKKQKEAHEEE